VTATTMGTPTGQPSPAPEQAPALSPAGSPALSVVIIGRNEGERLSACIGSVQGMASIDGAVEVIYVDSDSSDDSVERAEALGVKVIRVKPERPTAAIGRNAGWRAASAPLVLFLDGDTRLDPNFVSRALPSFADPSVAGVCGDRSEQRPQDSLYNRVLDLDWRGTCGETEFCGGDALIRRSVLEQVDGFDEGLIAGEEPDMWRRIQGLGYKAMRLDLPMTTHDLAMSRWSQYWRRATRTGYAYAEVSARYRDTERPLWAAVARRNKIHASVLLIGFAITLGLLLWSPWPLVAWLLLLAVIVVRTAWRQRWRGGSALTLLSYGVHSHLQQIPILVGQWSFLRSRASGRRRRLIEYKG
jgi:cellulose synthase/poly-beta-1,6-N-acetylglucosamine synthase-like glycosyltransferase